MRRALLDINVVLALLHGAKQVTDAHLLALATAHNGRFVSFDQSVELSAVRTAKKDNLTVLR